MNKRIKKQIIKMITVSIFISSTITANANEIKTNINKYIGKKQNRNINIII